MVAPAAVQDWGSIDESNRATLKNDIPKVRKKEYGLLNLTLDTILETKAVATENQVRVPGLSILIEKYLQTVTQGQHLQKRGWWKRIRTMRDWNDSENEFKGHCRAVWQLAHQTSFDVHVRADNLKVPPRVSIQRRRSLDGLVQGGSDPVQQHNQHGDTLMRSTPPHAGLVAPSSSENSINANTLQEETVRHIAEMSAAKTFELFILHGRLPGGPQTINNFNGCIVRPGGRATHTVNFGGKNNKGAAVSSTTGTTDFGGTNNGGEAVDPSPTSEADGNSLEPLEPLDDDVSFNEYSVV